jgi:alkylation response protein AidB-like acyl-CoA dehydrogenase
MAKNSLKGCGYLVAATGAEEVFTPEDFNDEQRQIGETTELFIRNEVLPKLEEIENQNFDLTVELLRKSGELGLLMIDPPEAYGGLELDKATSMLVAEKLAPAGSFAVAHMAHTGIGTLPLVYYGSDAQKGKYLGKLMSGEWIAAYCLTEPGSGSDALGAQTSAVLSADGSHYLLNGTKQFITNGGFADFFTVFAKVDKEHFTGFLIERGFAGVSFGAEEKKLGIKGSSTVQVTLDNARVPAENVLGQVGKGHKIAFNVLNIGRFKLGAMVTGLAKHALGVGLKYVNERKQFGKPVGSFGAIREKIADLSADIFASEAVVYRLAGLLDDKLATVDKGIADYYEQYLKGIEEYAAECAISKVFCSDMLSRVVDEVLQMHGGYGFISEYPAERFYRDERIQRIYEGTNEINRILIPGIFLRKGAQGDLPVQEGIDKALAALKSPAADAGEDGTRFAAEKASLQGLRTLFLALVGAATQKHGSKLAQEQEILMALADVAINIFAMESAQLRAEKILPALSEGRQAAVAAAVTVFTYNAVEDAARAAKKAAYFAADGEPLRLLLSGVKRLADYDAAGLLQAKRRLADAASEAEKYLF